MNINLKGKKVHFIGILGISMSALTSLAHDEGAIITGSDRAYNSLFEKVSKIGHCYIGSNTDFVKNADLVVYSGAIPFTDIELSYALSHHKPTLERCHFLGLLASHFKNVIAVSGTHGKTTTTAMISEMFYNLNKKASKPFACHIGGINKRFNSNFYHCGNDYFISEACEYKKSFLSFRPDIAVILNIDEDHPDCFVNIDELKDTFYDFAKRVRKGGSLLIPDDNLYDYLTDIKDIKIYRCGLDSKDISAKNIEFLSSGYFSYDLYVEGQFKTKIVLKSFGKHNVTNSLFAIKTALLSNIPIDIIVESLCDYQGTARRYELIGNINGADVILDYAHHPTEIQATIQTALSTKKKRIITVFEPHTYSRTFSLFERFTKCFEGVDELVLLPTYAAREKKTDGISSIQLFDEIQIQDKVYINNYKMAVNYLRSIAKQDDTILLLGAGNIEYIKDLI